MLEQNKKMISENDSLKQQAKQLTEEWIEKHYGKRCKVYTYGCPTCEMWITFDRLFADVEAEFTWMKIIKS
jgi:hypothetical protein